MINENNNNEFRRPTVSERENSKIEELSRSPKEINSPTDAANKKKLETAEKMLKERVEQMHEATKCDDSPPKYMISDKLNKGSDISFKANGPCEKLCLKCKVEVGYRY